MATAIDAAKQVFDKLQNSNKERRIAVFLKGTEEVQMTGVGTGLCNEAMRKRMRDLVGVYDREARIDWLVADLHSMGMPL